MSSLPYCTVYYSCSYKHNHIIRCSSPNTDPQGNKVNNGNYFIRINGNSGTAKASVSTSATTSPPPVKVQVQPPAVVKDRQNIPTKKQAVDHFRQGRIIDRGVGYQQTVVIRSYEVGPDKTASLEAMLNLLQETALNHVWMSGLLGDGFGATHGMIRNNLIWVVSRMQVQIDRYPIWGEVMLIDTWVGASGKNGMRRDWVIRSQCTQEVFARATSTWVMMNRTTRRLSKMPEEVRAEISPWFVERYAIQDDASEKIIKLDDHNAKYMESDLKPKRGDLDMNNHVNNVKYVGWMLEILPDKFLEAHQLSSITLEYRRECRSSDIVQSLCQPDHDGQECCIEEKDGSMDLLGGCAASMLQAPDAINGHQIFGPIGAADPVCSYTHLLQVKGEKKIEEIVRGRTTWKRKKAAVSRLSPFSRGHI